MVRSHLAMGLVWFGCHLVEVNIANNASNAFLSTLVSVTQYFARPELQLATEQQSVI